MGALDTGAVLLIVLIWGFNFVVVKVGVNQIPPIFALVLRFILVAVLLAPFLRPLGSRWRLVAALSVVFGSLHFGLLFAGLKGVDAGEAAIAIQLAVPFSAVLAWVVFREAVGVWQVAGMLVAFAGVYLLVGQPEVDTSTVHFLMVVGAALAWAVTNVIIKRLGRINVFVLNAWVALLAAPQLAVATWLLEDGQWSALAAADWRGWGAIVYTALGPTITAYGLWYWLISKHDMGRVIPMMLLVPVIAVLFAAALLDEPLTLRVIGGGLTTIVGVALIQLFPPRRAAAGTGG